MLKYVIYVCCLLSLKTIQVYANVTQHKEKSIFCDKSGTEYKFLTRAVTPKNSTEACRQFGGQLATIDSVEKIEFIQKKIKENNLPQAVVGLHLNVRRGAIEHLNGTILEDGFQKALNEYQVMPTPPHLVAIINPVKKSITRGYLCQRQTAINARFCENENGNAIKVTDFKPTTAVPGIKTDAKRETEIIPTRSIKTSPLFTQQELEIQKQEFLKHLNGRLSTILPHIKATTIKLHKQPLAKRDTTVGVGNTTGNGTLSNSTSVLNRTATDVSSFHQVSMDSDEYTNGKDPESDDKLENSDDFSFFDGIVPIHEFNSDDANVSEHTNDSTIPERTKVYQDSKHEQYADQQYDHVESPAATTSSVANAESATVGSENQPPVPSVFGINVVEISGPQNLPSASDLMNNISSAIETPSKEKSPDSAPILPNELSTIVEDLLPMLAPHHMEGPANDFRGPHESKEAEEARDDLISNYALSFMRVTSNLLKSENTDAWKEVASSKNISNRDSLTPSALLEQMDAVLDFSAASLGKGSQQLIFDSDELEVRLEHIAASNVTHLDVNADGTVRFPNSTLSRPIRSLSQNATQVGSLAVVTANYKSVPEILQACAEVSMQSLQNEIVPMDSNGTEENACSQKGFFVTDSLCQHMYPNATEPPKGVWTFPERSNVLSVTAYQTNIKKSMPVKFRIQGTETTSKTLLSKCVYYDVYELLWSDYGCEMKSVSDGKFTCFCNHTTNFAIMLLVPSNREKLVGVDVYDMAPSDGLCGVTLQMISFVVSGFSIAFLTVSVAFFAYARQTSERTVERNTVHMCFALSMLCLHLVLLMDNSNMKLHIPGGAPHASPDWFCYVITALTHFFLLCNFAWMSVEGILLYVLVVMGNKALGKWKHVIGWLLPMVIAGGTLTVAMVTQVPYVRLSEDTDHMLNTTMLQDEDGDVCYLAKDLTWAAFVPVLMSYILNFAITLRLVAVIGRLKKESRKYRPSGQQGTENQNNIKAARKSFIAFLKLNPLLGFPWIIGFVSSFVPQPYFCYLIFVHTCLNGIQGVIFFFVTVVENEESRSLIRLTWRKLRHNTNSFVSTLRPRRSLSYPVVALNNRPTASSTPPSDRHRTVHTPVLGGREVRPRNIVVSSTSPKENFHYV